MTERLLSPSKITAWLDCAHYLTLKHQVEAGTLKVTGPPFGALAQLLVDKGLQHEAECLAEYRRQGRRVLEIPQQEPGEAFADWVGRVGSPFDQDYDVIYQMPLVNDGARGIADFLVRAEDPETGAIAYEPVDAKLARADAKPGHVLQLCFYVEALEAMTGQPVEHIHLWLGSGEIQSLRAANFRAYWNRLRRQLASLLDDQLVANETQPEPCTHCDFCEFAGVCEDTWRSSDSLIYVAGIRSADRLALDSGGVRTVADLAAQTEPLEEIRAQRLERLVAQAELQVEARDQPEQPPPFRLIPQSDDPTWGRGFELMPQPDDGDIFLDFEGHPFWRADVGLFFLFGYIIQDHDGNWQYETIWAHDREEEASAVQQLVGFLVARREAHPAMHVYHYNHTERSALERLAAEHGVSEAPLGSLVETGLFVDLLLAVRNALQVGGESYGLKEIERLTSYVRGHDIDQGAGAVVEYERFTADRDTEHLDRIAAYNEDDVRATKAVRDWLVELRPSELDWRPVTIEPGDAHAELDAQVEALSAFDPDTPEHLLGEVLGYWLREHQAHIAPLLAKTILDTPTLLDDPGTITGLVALGEKERTGKTGKPLKPAMCFGWPEQEVGEEFEPGGSPGGVVYSTPSRPGYVRVVELDRTSREVDLNWNERAKELETMPITIVASDWLGPDPKPEALSNLAAAVLDPSTAGPPNEASLALLRSATPVFASGQGPPQGIFTDDLGTMIAWAPNLDRSYVVVQGPPGTGKTFRGAHMVHSLIAAGQRVGITAMSHKAIDNLLQEIIRVFRQHNDSANLKTIRKGKEPSDGGFPGVAYDNDARRCAKGDFNLVAGTTWLFANEAMKDNPVDTLIIDEAGQLALADALAASRSAHNLVLLGDPLQLPQVSLATHPGGGGLSVLEHVLGEDVTIPRERGVFLEETRRMHPDICNFISEEIYEGRLTSHPSCATQSTELGTGLRWLRADHTGRSTESPEEAELVAERIRGLIGTPWVDSGNQEAPLTATDFMVVAPYNDQVHLIREHLDADPRTRGIPVGTVDKFQGREAPVVFFTMTTSSAGDMPRGPNFLFSRNRLNVAISRARCLAYLVCTEDLLNSRARTVEEMHLISTLCAFVEHCSP